MANLNLVGDIKAKKLQNVYVVAGNEDLLIDEVEKHFKENIIPDEQTTFNLNILYGSEVNAAEIINTCSMYPMMYDKRLVIVREAQQIKNLDPLTDYIKNPVKSTILLLSFRKKNLDGRLSFTRAASKYGALYQVPKIYENHVTRWIADRLKNYNIAFDAEVPSLFIQLTGTELSRIQNEIEKILSYRDEIKTLDRKWLLEIAGYDREYNVFELQDAILERDLQKCLRIIEYFSSDPTNNHPVMVISMLGNYFSRLLFIKSNPQSSPKEMAVLAGTGSNFVQKKMSSATKRFTSQQLAGVVGILKEYDLKAKGYKSGSLNQMPGELLREMVVRIFGLF